jgi:hypothetical protein
MLKYAGVLPTILAFTAVLALLAIATTLNSYVRNAPRIEDVAAAEA